MSRHAEFAARDQGVRNYVSGILHAMCGLVRVLLPVLAQSKSTVLPQVPRHLSRQNPSK